MLLRYRSTVPRQSPMYHTINAFSLVSPLQTNNKIIHGVVRGGLQAFMLLCFFRYRSMHGSGPLCFTLGIPI